MCHHSRLSHEHKGAGAGYARAWPRGKRLVHERVQGVEEVGACGSMWLKHLRDARVWSAQGEGAHTHGR